MSAPIPIPSRAGSTSNPLDFLTSPKSAGGSFPIVSPHGQVSPRIREEKGNAKDLKQLTTQKTKVLLLEGVNKSGIELFERQGYEIETYAKALTDEEVKEKIKDVHVIGIRSKTMLTKEVLQQAKNLMAIGCFCIGTNQVNLSYAEERGIPVFNSPFSNSRSVAELVMGEIIGLSRKVGDKNDDLHAGVWNQPKVEDCFEIRGKTLGIVGYGHIGTQLSVLADSMGMRVIYYDIVPLFPLGTAKQVATLEELLQAADFVSLHVPATPQTKKMIGEEQLKLMKKGSFLINNARGTVVDVPALAKYLKSGHLAGAAVDVFPHEPEANGPGFQTELLGCPNVIMTPHIGGSTEEAQRAIGVEVANALIRYLKNGSTIGSVNFPLIELKNPSPEALIVRILNVHEHVPGVLRQINKIISTFNILKQFSESRGKIAYMAADLELKSQEDMKLLEEVQAELLKMPENLMTRILY